MAFQEPKIENKTVASPFGTWELNLYPMDKDKKNPPSPAKAHLKAPAHDSRCF